MDDLNNLLPCKSLLITLVLVCGTLPGCSEPNVPPGVEVGKRVSVQLVPGGGLLTGTVRKIDGSSVLVEIKEKGMWIDLSKAQTVIAFD